MSREFVRSYDTFTGITEILFIGKLLVCGVSLGLFPGPCIFTALLWRSSHFVLVVSACARAKQKPKGPGLGESFSFVHMDFVWAGHLFVFS